MAMSNLEPLTIKNAREYLNEMAYAHLPVTIFYNIREHVICDDRFLEAPGASSHHHNYRHGLLLHTAEVVQHCLNMTAGNYVKRTTQSTVDLSVLVAAAIWHDFAKVFEYCVEETSKQVPVVVPDVEFGSRVEAAFEDNTKIVKLPYMQLIGHPVGSAMEFCKSMHGVPVSSPKWIDDVVHCILSHHGRREWGAPVEPMTPEAHLLHAADMLSSHTLYRG